MYGKIKDGKLEDKHGHVTDLVEAFESWLKASNGATANVTNTDIYFIISNEEERRRA